MTVPENLAEELENTEMTELEEKDLEDVAGGTTINNGCNFGCGQT